MQSYHIVMFFNMQFFPPFVVLKAPCSSTLTHGTILVNIGLFAAGHSLLWQYGFWSFQTGDKKLERFLPKNQHIQMKLLNFENWINGGLRSFQKPEF